MKTVTQSIVTKTLDEIHGYKLLKQSIWRTYVLLMAYTGQTRLTNDKSL